MKIDAEKTKQKDDFIVEKLQENYNIYKSTSQYMKCDFRLNHYGLKIHRFNKSNKFAKK